MDDSKLMHEIDNFVQHLHRLIESGTSADRFLASLLSGATRLTRATAAGFWTPEDHRSEKSAERQTLQLRRAYEPTYFFQLLDAESLQHEGELLTELSANVTARLSMVLERRPISVTRVAAANPANHVAPFRLTLYFTSSVPNDALAGIERFVDNLARVIRDFQSKERIDTPLVDGDWSRYHQFVAATSTEGSYTETLHTVANELRRLLPCDRLFLLQRRAKSYQVLTCSGVDSVDPHAEVLHRLTKLVQVVARLGEAWQLPTNTDELEPEIAEPLELYRDVSPVQALAIIPLPTQRGATQPATFVLIAENFGSPTFSLSSVWTAALLQQAATSLQRAQRTSPWLVRLAIRAYEPVARWRRERPAWGWIVGTTLVLMSMAVAMLYPVPLRVEAEGELQPRNVRGIFASHDGFLEEIAASHGATVGVGQPLARIMSPELELELRRLLGELQTTQEQRASTEAERFQITGVDAASVQRINQLTASELTLKLKEKNLQEQLELVQRQESLLTLVSPIAGVVLDWDVQPRLEGRPVQRGQLLFEVADLTGPWLLRLRIPDRRMRHLLAARSISDTRLPVLYIVQQDPATHHYATLSTIATTTVSPDNAEPYVPAEVDLPVDDLPHQRPGSRVIAKIACGKRSLGFVLFHELCEELRRRFF